MDLFFFLFLSLHLQIHSKNLHPKFCPPHISHKKLLFTNFNTVFFSALKLYCYIIVLCSYLSFVLFVQADYKIFFKSLLHHFTIFLSICYFFHGFFVYYFVLFIMEIQNCRLRGTQRSDSCPHFRLLCKNTDAHKRTDACVHV